VKLLGGARHVAGLHHAHEVSELAQVHERLLRRQVGAQLRALCGEVGTGSSG
jgi:hypothetical protein